MQHPLAFLNGENTTPCDHIGDLTRGQHELIALVMARLDQQDSHIAANRLAIQELRQQVAGMSEMLTTFGDLCYALAAATARLTADS